MMHVEDASFVSFCRCDIYENKSLTEQEKLIEGFLRFLEIANKMRRPGQNRETKGEFAGYYFHPSMSMRWSN